MITLYTFGRFFGLPDASPFVMKGEMLLALKSGNFGGPEFFSDALKLMQ